MFQAELTNTILADELRHHEHGVDSRFSTAPCPTARSRRFSRGGSDITGAVVARAVDADRYENWTDVSGFLMADPRIIDNPRRINQLTYRELRELSYMGATVLHEGRRVPGAPRRHTHKHTKHKRSRRSRYDDCLRYLSENQMNDYRNNRHRRSHRIYDTLHRKGHDEQRAGRRPTRAQRAEEYGVSVRTHAHRHRYDVRHNQR